MGINLNQHYVPQFYFRQFNGGQRYIHLLRKNTGEMVYEASVKHQCAGHNFYGCQEIESMLSQIEELHRTSLRHLIELAWSPQPPGLRPDIVANMWSAVILQRLRTELETKKSASAHEAVQLQLFKSHLERREDSSRNSDIDRLIGDIHAGNFRVSELPQRAVNLRLVYGLKGTLLISDLYFCVLRNCTDIPFIFSDSPVVFCNSYCRDVTERGVLGLQSPGLQIFMPLDSQTLLLLYDGQVYRGQLLDKIVMDLCERSDVSQLNALQLHHSLRIVYFSEREAGRYVWDLWSTHKNKFRPLEVSFKTGQTVHIQGKDVQLAWHFFERHLNHDLNLSFITCTPVRASKFVFHDRDPELVAEYRRRCSE